MSRLNSILPKLETLIDKYSDSEFLSKVSDSINKTIKPTNTDSKAKPSPIERFINNSRYGVFTLDLGSEFDDFLDGFAKILNQKTSTETKKEEKTDPSIKDEMNDEIKDLTPSALVNIVKFRGTTDFLLSNGLTPLEYFSSEKYYNKDICIYLINNGANLRQHDIDRLVAIGENDIIDLILTKSIDSRLSNKEKRLIVLTDYVLKYNVNYFYGTTYYDNLIIEMIKMDNGIVDLFDKNFIEFINSGFNKHDFLDKFVEYFTCIEDIEYIIECGFANYNSASLATKTMILTLYSQKLEALCE